MESAATPAYTPAAETRWWHYLLDDERFLGSAMLLPAVIFIVLLVGVPFVLAILFSFSDITAADLKIDRLTLDSFRRVVCDVRELLETGNCLWSWSGQFQRALVNNVVFTVVSQGLVIILANVLALVLTREFRGKWFLRLVILLPWATPIAVSIMGWLWIFDSLYSPIDWVFRQTGLLGLNGVLKNSPNMYWLGDPGLAMVSIVVVHVWRMLPMSTVIIMAGLTSISPDIKDAVAVDGAGFRQEFFEVTLPLIRPIALVALLFGIIFTFTDLTVAFVLAHNVGVQVLSTLAYDKGISSGSLAEGAAMVIFMLPVLLGVAMLMLRLARQVEVR